MTYEKFLKSKIKTHIDSGFKISDNKLNDKLFDFQKYITSIALRAGRYAIFANTGLGKTAMQLEWGNQVIQKTNKPVLLLAPLGVTGQTIKEGDKFDIEIARTNKRTGKNIHIHNYEQLHKLDTSIYSGIILDESSILKNYTGKYKNLIIDTFKKTPYKLPCTATPSPNDINEIGNHSEFLNILDSQDMRARWFVRDEGMNNYRLKTHAKGNFYGWVSSWCTMIMSPGDIGFTKDAKRFKLPELNYFEYEIEAQLQNNGKLFNDTSVNATTFNSELRRTINERLGKTLEIVQKTKGHIIIWVNQNAEADLICKMLKGMNESFAEVRGNETPELKEKKLLGFADGDFRILITKKKIAQFGLNYQHCHNQIFASLDFSFEGLYQAIRRSYRFGQKENVNIHLITTDTMGNVMESIQKKEKQFEELRSSLNKNINAERYNLVMDYEKEEIKTDNYHIIKGDSVQEIDSFPDNSFDFSIFSPPFSSLFTYSNSYRDMGNSTSHAEFFEQNQFLLNKLFKKMKPGRIVCVHSKDLAVYKNSSGYTGLYNFSGDYHKAMENAGFRYHSKVTIWTDPVLEMQRTKTQRLLYKQLRKDSTYSGVGLPEYLTIFKKWEGVTEFEESHKPVNNKNFDNFSLDTWQRWASPTWGKNISKSDLLELMNHYFELNGVRNFQDTIGMNPELFTGTWFDIRRTDVLNSKQGTAIGDEKHIAPLQLTVIRRALKMWSNPGEIVFTPFLGIGSELYESIKANRFGCGVELKDSYFATAQKNLQRAIESQNQKELFESVS